MLRAPIALVLLAVAAVSAPTASAEPAAQPPAARAPDAPLTRADIVAMRDQITEAVRRRDAAAVVSHLAEDATIRMVMPAAAGGGQQTIEISVPQYRQMLEQAWAQVGQHTYAVEDLRVKVGRDGRTAMVTDTVIESVQAGGQVLRTRTREVFAVEVRGGRLVITSMTGTLQM